MSNSVDWESVENFNRLYNKLSAYLIGSTLDVEDRTAFIKHLEDDGEDCPWQEESLEDDAQSFDEHAYEEKKLDGDYQLTFSDIQQLESLPVIYKGKNKILKFEDGISGMLDICLGEKDDDLILDVTKLVRKESELHAKVISGWIVFKVESFPATWEKLLELDKTVQVEEK